MRELVGKNPYTIFLIIGLVSAQVGISYWVSSYSWWVVFAVAYVAGAFISHALWVMIHETSHGLIFKGKVPNLLAGIIANLPHIFARFLGSKAGKQQSF